MSILINPNVYLSPPLLRKAFRLLANLKFSFPARSCSFKRKPEAWKVPRLEFLVFHLEEINKSKRRSLGIRLRLNEQERAGNFILISTFKPTRLRRNAQKDYSMTVN